MLEDTYSNGKKTFCQDVLWEFESPRVRHLCIKLSGVINRLFNIKYYIIIIHNIIYLIIIVMTC